jgi:hypothetical protein
MVGVITTIYWLSTTLMWLRLPLHPPRYTDYLPHSGDYAYHYIHHDILTIYHTRVIMPTITSTKIYWLSTTLGWLHLPLHPPRYTDYLPHLGDYAYHYIHQDILIIYHTRVNTPIITFTKIYWLSTTLGWIRLSLHSPRYTDYLPHSGDYAYHYIHQDIPTIYNTRAITPTITSTKIYWLSTTLGRLRLPLHPPRYTDYLQHSRDYAYHYIHVDNQYILVDVMVGIITRVW